MVSIKTLMSKTGTLDDSRRLSKFVQDSADYKWAQIHRKMTAAAPTPLPKKILHTSFFDTSSTDAQGIAEILATVGIAPLIGQPIGSPMQRLHITSEIGRLNALNVEGVPQLESLEDVALLSKSSARRLKKQAINARVGSREENIDRDEEAEERGLQRSRLAAVGRRVQERGLDRQRREADRQRRMVVRSTPESRAIREQAGERLRRDIRLAFGRSAKYVDEHADILATGVQAGEVSGLDKALRISVPTGSSSSSGSGSGGGGSAKRAPSPRIMELEAKKSGAGASGKPKRVTGRKSVSPIKEGETGPKKPKKTP
jgi:hypothetical protein